MSKSESPDAPAPEKTSVILEAEKQITELEKKIEPVDEPALTAEAIKDFVPAKPAAREGELKDELKHAEAARVMFVAGDISGDAYGASLIAALKKAKPGIEVIGCGGPKMAAEGQSQLYDLTKHAVVGVAELAKHLLSLNRVVGKIIDLASRQRPEVVVFIDYSGFNLRLLGRLRGLLKDSKLIYFVSPQVWASRPQRAQQMARDLDLLLSIFPFEKQWYADHASKLKVEWVGHPKLDMLEALDTSQCEKGRIGILPGSREKEVLRHLPILWEAAKQIYRVRPDSHFALMAPDVARQEQIRDWIEAQPAVGFAYNIVTGYTLSHLNRCELALVKSGTGSLDCALMGVPQIVVYKVNPLTYAIGRRVVKVQHLSMVNVLAGDKDVVPELIQKDMTADKIALHALELLNNPERMEAMKKEMANVVAGLGEPGAIGRASTAVAEELAKVPNAVRLKRKELVQKDLDAAIKRRLDGDEADKQKLALAAINAKKAEQNEIQKGIDKAKQAIKKEHDRIRREKERAEREKKAAEEKARREKEAAERRKKQEAEKAEKAKLAAAEKARKEKEAAAERERQAKARAEERAKKEAELKKRSEEKAKELAAKKAEVEKAKDKPDSSEKKS